MHDVGRTNGDRAAKVKRLLAEFHRHRLKPEKQLLQNQLHATTDHTEAVELLRQLQDR
jgi:hypothetical protein